MPEAAEAVAPVRGQAADGEAPSPGSGGFEWAGGEGRAPSSPEGGANAQPIPQVGDQGCDTTPGRSKVGALRPAEGLQVRDGSSATTPGGTGGRPPEPGAPHRRDCPRPHRPSRRPRPGAPSAGQSGGAAGRSAPRPRPEPARHQPMGGRARPPNACSPRGAGSEREKRTQPVGAAAPDPPLPPSPPPPPGSGVLSQPESPVLRPGSGERAR